MPRKNASFSSSSFLTAAGHRRGRAGLEPRQARAPRARRRRRAARAAGHCRCAGKQRCHPLPCLLCGHVPAQSPPAPGSSPRPAGPAGANDRCSHAWRNSSFGESGSIARANRSSSRSFQRGSLYLPPPEVGRDFTKMTVQGLLGVPRRRAAPRPGCRNRFDSRPQAAARGREARHQVITQATAARTTGPPRQARTPGPGTTERKTWSDCVSVKSAGSARPGQFPRKPRRLREFVR